MSSSNNFRDDRADNVRSGTTLSEVLRRLWPFFMRQKLAFAMTILAVLALAGAARLAVTVFGMAIDEGLVKRDRDFVVWAALAYLGIESGRMILAFLHGFIFSRLGNRILFEIRDQLVRHVQSLPISYFDRHPSGRIVTRLTNDVVSLGELFTQGIITVFASIVSLIAIVIAMSAISIQMTLATLMIAPPLVWLVIRLSRRLLEAQRESKAQLAGINAFVAENIGGMRVLQLYGKVGRTAERFSVLSGNYRSQAIQITSLYALLWPATSFFNAISIGAALFVGSRLTIDGAITTGAMVAFILHVRAFIDPLNVILEKYQIFQNALSGAERIFTLLDEVPEDSSLPEMETRQMGLRPAASSMNSPHASDASHAADAADAADATDASLGSSHLPTTNESKSTMPSSGTSQEASSLKATSGSSLGLPPTSKATSSSPQQQIKATPNLISIPTPSDQLRLRGDIDFINLSFRYKPDLPLTLREVHLSIRAGESVALVGRTGSGKSTIIALLQRLYDPSEGDLRIDGRPISSLQRRQLRARIGVVQQDTFIFRGTIAQNIALGDPRVDRHRIEAAAEEAHLTEVLRRQNRTLESPVEERGANLSFGERQLIAFARILAFDPDVLILDEATANIDSRTESLIQDATRKVRKGRTSLIVAHRISTILDCDKIVVLDQGRVIEVGSHSELYAKGPKFGAYRRLCDAQFKNSFHEESQQSQG